MGFRIALVFVVVLLIGVTVRQAYRVVEEYRTAKARFDKVYASVRVVDEENAELRDEVRYLEDPENAVKELRTRFNYRLPGEKLIIVAPRGE